MHPLFSKIVRTLSGTGQAEAANAAPGRFELLVPAYFYPAGQGLHYWNELILAASRVRIIAIMNPSSGPGVQMDPAYRAIADRARAAGVTVIGYVATGFGSRPAEEVSADLIRYSDYYLLDGVFVDEMSNDGSAASLAFYSSIYAQVKASGPSHHIIGNPGVNPHESYLSEHCADALIAFEQNQEAYQRYQAPRWMTGRAPQSIGHLVYRVPSLGAARRLLDRSAQSGAGLVYFTDDDLDNPWDTLPTYWHGLVSEIQQRNLKARDG